MFLVCARSHPLHYPPVKMPGAKGLVHTFVHHARTHVTRIHHTDVLCNMAVWHEQTFVRRPSRGRTRKSIVQYMRNAASPSALFSTWPSLKIFSGFFGVFSCLLFFAFVQSISRASARSQSQDAGTHDAITHRVRRSAVLERISKDCC